MSRRRAELFVHCPGPKDAPAGAECVEGCYWLPEDDPNGPIPERDCPRCNGAGKLELVARWAVCSRCEGTGVHDHPAFSDGFSAEDFYRDPDFAEEYKRGVYDVVCTCCAGLSVEAVVDEERTEPELLELYRAELQEEADSRAMYEAERRAGA